MNPFAPIDAFSFIPADAPAVAPQTSPKSLAVGVMRAALSIGQPGAWASDHRTESDRFTGWNYVAIHTLAKMAMSATVAVYDDQRSGVAKAVRKSWQGQFGGVWKAVKANEPEAKSLPDDHPLVARLLRASPTQSGATFRYEQIVQIGLTGGCLIWNVPNRANFTCERYVIPTAVAQPVQATRDLPRGGYYISPSAVRRFQASMVDEQGFVEMSGYFAAIGQVIPMEQLQRVGWPHPIYKDDFQSSVSAAAVWNDTADMTDKSRWAQLKNGPNSSLAISPGEDVQLTPELADQAAAKLAQKYCGAENHGKPFILPNGSTVTSLTTTPRDMVYGEAFEQFRDSLMAIHGVAPQAAGITLEGGYANFVAAIKQTTMLALQPVLDLIAAEDTAQLAPKYGPGLTVEYEAPNIDDPQQIETMLATDAAVGARSLNEHRSIRGLPPVAWGEQRAISGGVVASATPGVSLPGDSSLVHSGQPQGAEATGDAGVGIESSLTLNGAQIDSARSVLLDVRLGNLPPTAAVELMVAVGIERRRAEAMVQSLQGMPPPTVNADGKPLPQAQGEGQPPAGSEPTPRGGEFRGMKRRDLINSRKGTRETLEQVAMSEISTAYAIEDLIALGWSETAAQRLVDDAKDGAIEEDAEEPEDVPGVNRVGKLLNGHNGNGHSNGEAWLDQAVRRGWETE